MTRNIIAKITLNACEETVAIAAPAASMWKTATSSRSPNIFTMHATSTKRSGERLSPSPRNIADNRLYATIKKIPPPQIRTYAVVCSRASGGACIITEIGCARVTIITNNTAENIVNTTAAPPITAPIFSVFFSPRYLAIKTVIPMANWLTTNVARFKI